MRLLFLNHNVRYGGTYYRAMPMAVQLAKRGHELTLLTVSPEHRWRPTWSRVDGVRLGEMPNLGQSFSGEGYGPLDNVLRLAHSLGRRYDLIHMFGHKPNASFPGFAGRVLGSRLIADWADWWGGPGGINDVPKRRVPAVGRFEEWWEIQSKLCADGVVTISTVLQQRALEIGCPPARVVHVPTGAATDRIHPLPRAEARQRLGIPVDRRMVGFIGMGQGDLDIIMRAQQQLPKVWLMVVGRSNPGVLEQAAAYGVADRLWQTGFVSDSEVSTYLSCADVMCLPMADRASNRGRLPNKMLDYLAVGRPTVANPIGDVRAIIEGHRVGLLARDDDAFAQAIATLLDDQSLSMEMGLTARRVAETVYAWPTVLGRLEEFYEMLLAAR